LATASGDNTVKVWDAATGQELHTLEGHSSDVRGVAFSPDGSRLATASRDGTVKLWDVATGQEALTLRGHVQAVVGIVFSPDGHQLLSASWDGTIKVWDTRPLTPEVRVEREAVGLLDFLFARPLRKADVVESLRGTPTLGQPARDRALALADHYREEQNPERYHAAGRAAARHPSSNRFQNQLALPQRKAT